MALPPDAHGCMDAAMPGASWPVPVVMLTRLPPELVQTVLDALPTPVFFKDRAGIYQGCNRAYSDLMALTVDDFIGKSVFDLWPADLATVYHRADEAVMAAGGEQRYEAQIQLPDGQRRDVVFYKTALKDANGEVAGLVGTLLDITERKTMERQLHDLAHTDALTGLLNRRAIMAHLEALHADRRKGQQPLALLMCDVDHFKAINDAHGHEAGDAVLVEVAQLIQAQLREDDRVGRVGGEEFLVVLASTCDKDATRVAERLRSVVSETPFAWQGQAVAVTLSMGLVHEYPSQESCHDLVRRADKRLYAAKRGGRNKVVHDGSV